jgi:hypothetical protein
MKKSTQLLLAGASVAFALNANATPVVTTHTTPTLQSATVTDLESFDDGVTTLDLTKFNTTLGVLKSVKVELFTDFTGTIKVENLSTTSSLKYTQWVGSSVTLTVLPGSSLTADKPVSQLIDLGKYDGATNYAGLSGTAVGFSANGYQSVVYTDSDILNAFSGAGALVADVSGATSSWGALPNGNQKNSIPTQIDTYAKVTYTYEVTAVPEPETYAMLLAGLGLMGVVARRRKSA